MIGSYQGVYMCKCGGFELNYSYAGIKLPDELRVEARLTT